jgi:hypothetical protein
MAIYHRWQIDVKLGLDTKNRHFRRIIGVPNVSLSLLSLPPPQSVANVRGLGENRLGTWLRELRQGRGLPLRVVAPAAVMDTTSLSNVEPGQRLPTEGGQRTDLGST